MSAYVPMKWRRNVAWLITQKFHFRSEKRSSCSFDCFSKPQILTILFLLFSFLFFPSQFTNNYFLPSAAYFLPSLSLSLSFSFWFLALLRSSVCVASSTPAHSFLLLICLELPPFLLSVLCVRLKSVICRKDSKIPTVSSFKMKKKSHDLEWAL